jgi:hypothetical protein
MSRIEELQAQLNNIQDQINSLNNKWEIPGGDYYLDIDNVINKGDSSIGTKLAGREFKTQEAAIKAKIHYTNVSILFHLAEYLNDGWEPNWDDELQEKYGLMYNHNIDSWVKTVNNFCQAPAAYFSYEAANKALKILNNEELIML